MNELPKRKQIRLSGYDYSQNGCYFVTICTQNRDCLFGDIVGVGRDRPAIMLNEYGKIVENVWYSLPDHHPVELYIFQIMPNHIHFVLVIDNTGGQTGASRNDTGESSGASRRAPTRKPTLGFIVGMFKTECTKQINQFRKTPGGIVFQRNYYEHIIRNENELYKIREYIELNPEMWERDRNNPNHI